MPRDNLRPLSAPVPYQCQQPASRSSSRPSEEALIERGMYPSLAGSVGVEDVGDSLPLDPTRPLCPIVMFCIVSIVFARVNVSQVAKWPQWPRYDSACRYSVCQPSRQAPFHIEEADMGPVTRRRDMLRRGCADGEHGVAHLLVEMSPSHVNENQLIPGPCE